MKNLSLLLLVLSIITSCRKQQNIPIVTNTDTVVQTGLSKVTYKNDITTTIYQLHYDAHHRIDSMWIVDTTNSGAKLVMSYYYKKFDYYDGYFKTWGTGYGTYAKNQKSPIDLEHKTIGVNANDLITYVVGQDLYHSSDSFTEVENTYNDSGQLIQSNANDIVTTISYYRWNIKGNIDSVSSDQYFSTPTIWAYDTAKPGQPWDAAGIGQFLEYGRPFFINKNLLVKAGANSYNYVFDNEGRITRLWYNDPFGLSISYTYEYY